MSTTPIRLAHVLSVLILTLSLLPVAAQAKRNKDKDPGATAVAAEGTPTAELPTAASLFAGHLQAIGGEQTLRSHSTLTLTMVQSVPAQGLQATVVVHAKAPNMVQMTTEIPGLGEIRNGFDGKVAWSVDPMAGPQVLEGEAAAFVEQSAQFYGDIEYARLYPTMETVARTEVDGTDVYQVHTVTVGGDDTTMYFDAESGLIVAMDAVVDTEMGPIPVHATLDDYQEIGGVLMSMKASETTGPIASSRTTTSAVWDDPAFPALTLPAEIQALLDEIDPAE